MKKFIQKTVLVGMGLSLLTVIFMPVITNSNGNGQQEEVVACKKNCFKSCATECKSKIMGKARTSCEMECRKTCPDKCELGELQSELRSSKKPKGAIDQAVLQRVINTEKARVAAEKAKLAEEEMAGLPEPGSEGTYVESPRKSSGSWWGRTIKSR